MSICCRAKFAIDRGSVVRSSILPCKCGIARRVHGADLDLVNNSQTIRAQETMSSRSFSFMCLLPRMCLLPTESRAHPQDNSERRTANGSGAVMGIALTRAESPCRKKSSTALPRDGRANLRSKARVTGSNQAAPGAVKERR